MSFNEDNLSLCVVDAWSNLYGLFCINQARMGEISYESRMGDTRFALAILVNKTCNGARIFRNRIKVQHKCEPLLRGKTRGVWETDTKFVETGSNCDIIVHCPRGGIRGF